MCYLPNLPVLDVARKRNQSRLRKRSSYLYEKSVVGRARSVSIKLEISVGLDSPSFRLEAG